jgi:NTE family protein
MTKRALVLGGGGVLGIAWEAGVVAGLGEQGLQVGDADLIVGTSAGSVVGSQLAQGKTPAEIVAMVTEPVERDGLLDPSELDVEAIGKIFMKWAAAPAFTKEVCAEIGGLALAAKTIPEEQWIGPFLERATDGWPERPLKVTAVDVGDGSFVAWDRDSGADLGRAVASSCTVPGLFAPVSINGRRYMDGGVRSIASADLAAGYENVLIIAPISTQPTGIGPAVLRDLKLEVTALKQDGATVEMVLPDAASLAAFGPNMMDPAFREASLQAGFRQGREAAGRVRDLWAGAAV